MISYILLYIYMVAHPIWTPPDLNWPGTRTLCEDTCLVRMPRTAAAPWAEQRAALRRHIPSFEYLAHVPWFEHPERNNVYHLSNLCMPTKYQKLYCRNEPKRTSAPPLRLEAQAPIRTSWITQTPKGRFRSTLWWMPRTFPVWSDQPQVPLGILYLCTVRFLRAVRPVYSAPFASSNSCKISKTLLCI